MQLIQLFIYMASVLSLPSSARTFLAQAHLEKRSTFTERLEWQHYFKSLIGLSPISSLAFHQNYKFTGKKLGRGSNGVVLEAFDKHTLTHVAVKIGAYPYEFGKPCERIPEVAVMLKAELAGVHVINYVGCGWESDRAYYIITDLVTNKLNAPSFQDYLALEPKGVVSNRVAVAYIAQLAEVLFELHGMGIYHGDIKSANILINDARDLVLIDFGASRVLPQGVAKISHNAGSWLYSSPEARECSRSARMFDAFKNDVYGLGVTFLIMLAGDVGVNTDFGRIEYEEKFGVYDANTIKVLKGMLDDNERTRWSMWQVLDALTRLSFI